MRKRVKRKGLTDDEIKTIVLEAIDEAEDYQAVLADIGEENLKLWEADDFLDYEDGYSGANTSDAFDVVESLAATIIRVFQSDPDILQVEPEGPTDEDFSEFIAELIKFQDQKQNHSWIIFHDWIKTALLNPLAAIKQTWYYDEESEEVEVDGIGIPWVAVLAQSEGVEITSIAPSETQPGTAKITVRKIISKTSKPVFEALPPEEFLISPESKDLDDAFLVAHKQTKTLSDLREMGFSEEDIEGLESDIVSKLDSPEYLARWGDTLTGWLDESRGGSNDANRKVVVYECYVSVDRDGDGIVEPYKVMIGNDTLLEIEENSFERPPFHILGGTYRMPFRMHGKSVAEAVSQLQKVHTTLWRQVMNWLYINNMGRYVGDPDKVDIGSFLNNNRPGGFIEGDPSAIKGLMPAPIDARFLEKTMEGVREQKEDRTGVTRYQQGSDSRSLNKTAHGISLIFSAAQQRVEQICKIWAETGFRDFYLFRMDLNRKFLDPDVPVRVLGEWQKVDPAKFDTDYDITIDVNMGKADKQMQVGILSNILGMQLQMLGKLPFITPQNVYHTFKRLIATTGERAVDLFVTPPQQGQGGMLPNGQGSGVVEQGQMGGGSPGPVGVQSVPTPVEGSPGPVS